MKREYAVDLSFYLTFFKNNMLCNEPHWTDVSIEQKKLQKELEKVLKKFKIRFTLQYAGCKAELSKDSKVNKQANNDRAKELRSLKNNITQQSQLCIDTNVVPEKFKAKTTINSERLFKDVIYTRDTTSEYKKYLYQHKPGEDNYKYSIYPSEERILTLLKKGYIEAI